jgi:TatD DNase family protein
MGWHDIHAHLTDKRLAEQEADVLARARTAGVTTIVSNGLNPIDNQRTADVAARSHGLVKAAFGLYPVDAVGIEMAAAGVDYDFRDKEPIIGEDAVAWVRDHLDDAVAVGEIGLDHYWVPDSLWTRQEEVFRQLVQLGIDADKPIIIHSRKAERRCFEILVEMGATKVNWHCYSSKVKLGRQIAAHGHWLSIPANVRRAENFTRLLQTLPRDKVLLETDCPYLSPDRGELNEPANVARTGAFAAELWDCTPAEVQAQVSENFETLFGFAP